MSQLELEELLSTTQNGNYEIGIIYESTKRCVAQKELSEVSLP